MRTTRWLADFNVWIFTRLILFNFLIRSLVGYENTFHKQSNCQNSFWWCDEAVDYNWMDTYCLKKNSDQIAEWYSYLYCSTFLLTVWLSRYKKFTFAYSTTLSGVATVLTNANALVWINLKTINMEFLWFAQWMSFKSCQILGYQCKILTFSPISPKYKEW